MIRDLDREFDVVVLGATGFAGGLTADYLAEHAPAGLRWAVAGRSPEKLATVRDRLVGADPAVITVDVTDPAPVAELAGRTKVLATTVGPYLEYGEPLVRACAEAGTDYVDLTGEPEFVDTMFTRYDAVARSTGTRIVHACGFDSVPHDLGAYFAIRELAVRGPLDGPVRMRGVVRAKAGVSGGTFHSALGQLSRARRVRTAALARKELERRPSGRSSRAVAGRPHRDPVLGYWLLPLPTIDPQIVARSGRALAAYGPDFRYSHYAGTKTLRYAAGGVATVGALALGAQVPPLRRWLGNRMPQGEGPSERRREGSWFTVDFVAETTASDGTSRSAHTRVSGGDPGYGETAKMLAESALCLACDDLPETAGSVTTAQAMGEALLPRLVAAGLTFEVVDE